MMEIKLFKNWWVMLINGIIFTVLGIASIFSPFTAILTVALYIGFAALFSGFFLLVFSLSNTRQEGWGWYFLAGLIDLIFGLVLLLNPVLAAILVPFLVGIWVFIRGIMYVIESFSWRKTSRSRWGGYALLGVLLAALGFYMILDWQFTLIPVAFLIAVILLAIGIGSIVIAFDARRLRKLIMM